MYFCNSTKLNLWFVFWYDHGNIAGRIQQTLWCESKLKAIINNIDGELNNAVDKQVRKVKIERLIVKCKDAFTRVVEKNEELFGLAQKTEDLNAACKNLEKKVEDCN